MKGNKIFLLLLGIITFSLVVPSCTPDYMTDFEEMTLQVDNRDQALIRFSREGGDKIIPVKTNVDMDKWNAYSNADWCKVDKTKDGVVVLATANDLYLTRNARVTVEYGHQSYTIDVTQQGEQPILLVEGLEEGLLVEVDADGGVVNVTVTSNVIIDHITIPDQTPWVQFVGVEELSESDEKILTFEVDLTYAMNSRTSTILIQSSDNYNHTASFVIQQNKREWGTPIAIPLTVDMLTANATQAGDGQGLPGLIDGNVNTFYHTLWSAASPGGKLHYVQFNLNEAIQYLSITYASRNGGNGAGDVTRAGIWVSETGGENETEWTKAATIHFDLPSGRGASTSSTEVAVLHEMYKHIRFVPEARRNADPIDPSGANGWWNMADLYLYTY